MSEEPGMRNMNHIHDGSSRPKSHATPQPHYSQNKMDFFAADSHHREVPACVIGAGHLWGGGVTTGGPTRKEAGIESMQMAGGRVVRAS